MDYPDPEEEYDLMYQDEMDALREMDEEIVEPDYVSKKSRLSLNFDVCKSPAIAKNAENYGKRTSEEIQDFSEIYPVPKKRKGSVVLTASELDLGVNVLDPPSSATQPQTMNCLHGTTSLKFPSWNFLTLNTDFGERLFVRLREDSAYKPDFQANYQVSESFKLLKENVVRAIVAKSEDVKHEVQSVGENLSSELWVDQFKPKRYLELLSDEGVNRALLYWIKSWDKIVFSRERIKKAEKEKPTQFKPKYQILEEKAVEMDEDGRPRYKLALLCGPPGIGKTTLAHVIASVAGYNVIEINASDDRSVECFRTNLQNATEMQSIAGDKKPNCLILDEIDGAPSASIDFLIKYINGKQTKKGKKMIRRPVICVCNEPYTPALRQLRQQAYVLNFPHTSSTKLAQRLMEICRNQGMHTDLSTLALLCDKAQSDIRSCITTLNFFKTNQKTRFRSGDVAKADIGVKDMQKSLFSVWQEIFQKRVKTAGFGCEEKENYFAYHPENMKRFQHIIQMMTSAGDYEKLQQGVYENFLKVQFPWFQHSVEKGLDWFCWSDLINQSIKQEQNFVLMPYLPYAFASWHFLFSTTTYPKITYPSVGYENHVKATKFHQITTDVLRGLNPVLRAHSQRSHMLLDVLPLLPRILAPALRPVNATLFNDREKMEFQNVVDVLLDFNMNFVQQRAEDGTYFYAIDPNFEQVTQFPVQARAKSTELSYNNKQIIAREVELERVRRTEKPSARVEKKSETGNETKAVAKPIPKFAVPVADETVQYKDFFGRIVQVQRPNGLGKSSYVKSRIWFSFKEGFNNAVKKDLTIRDLL